TPEFLAYNNKNEIISITSTVTGIALIVVLLRVYVRSFMLGVFGIDDYIMLVSMAISSFVAVCFGMETKYGLGKHMMAIDRPMFSDLSKWTFFHALFVMIAISCVKISIAFFLLRLASRTRYKKLLWGAVVFIVVFTIACSFTLIFQCTPVSAAWNYSLRAPTGTARCFTMLQYRNIGLMNSSINIATDVLFAVLPIPLILSLKVNRRTKISLTLILSLGIFACAAGMVKAVQQYHVLTDRDWTVHDSFNVWNDIELNVGIVAASLPSLKPLFAWMLDSARALTNNSENRSRPRSIYPRNSSLGY
ncbi:hypothetical protein M501DRAFT_902028, partial [Patellaria atrata CBS 101060]